MYRHGMLNFTHLYEIMLELKTLKLIELNSVA